MRSFGRLHPVQVLPRSCEQLSRALEFGAVHTRKARRAARHRGQGYGGKKLSERRGLALLSVGDPHEVLDVVQRGSGVNQVVKRAVVGAVARDQVQVRRDHLVHDAGVGPKRHRRPRRRGQVVHKPHKPKDPRFGGRGRRGGRCRDRRGSPGDHVVGHEQPGRCFVVDGLGLGRGRHGGRARLAQGGREDDVLRFGRRQRALARTPKRFQRRRRHLGRAWWPRVGGRSQKRCTEIIR